jgi:hypothetical protein
MPKNEEAGEDPGAKDGKFASHRWLGGNSLMPAYYHFPEQAAKLAEFLRNGPDGKGVLNVDIFGLEKESAAATSGDNVEIAPLQATTWKSPRSASLTSPSPPAKPSPPTSSSRTRASPTR